MTMIERTVLREQVKDVLLQRIVSGELKPGERLVETRIASELGTSQAPVREALRDLELLRMVESEPFRGARVRAFGDEELVEVYPVRAALEELAAKEATKRLDGDVAVLEREVDAMRAAARARRPERARRSTTSPSTARWSRRPGTPCSSSAGSRSASRGGSRSRSTGRTSSRTTRPRSTSRSSTRSAAGKPGAAGREARKHVEEFGRIARRRAKAAGR